MKNKLGKTLLSSAFLRISLKTFRVVIALLVICLVVVDISSNPTRVQGEDVNQSESAGATAVGPEAHARFILRSENLQIFLTFFHFSSTLFVFSTICFVVENVEHLTEVTQSMQLLSIWILGCVKWHSIVRKKQQIRDLIEILQKNVDKSELGDGQIGSKMILCIF